MVGPELLSVLLIVALLGVVWCASRADRGLPVGVQGRPASDAEERAEALVRELLTEAEYRQLDESGYLEVPSPAWPERIYRVPRQRGQIRVYEDGVLARRLCVESVEPIPDGDALLLHKLMIEGNEEQYLRIANSFLPRPDELHRRAGSR